MLTCAGCWRYWLLMMHEETTNWLHFWHSVWCKKEYANLELTRIDFKKIYVEFLILVFWKVWNSCKCRKGLSNLWINWWRTGTHSLHQKKISDIRGGRFYGNSLSSLLFAICMVQLSQILGIVESGYTLKSWTIFTLGKN